MPTLGFIVDMVYGSTYAGRRGHRPTAALLQPGDGTSKCTRGSTSSGSFMQKYDSKTLCLSHHNF